ncbi:AAA domain-containing protein [Spirosoma oryzae]|uniref:AAA domain-containing protein n=1 Tax=Spirosoma oryzae TaxID=1469603 RepID=A0A2T0SYP3_9BACT|nr:AAA family ATPase [Spirosoma oryzae]PRY38524.1 AAA domain-containing protein [Spirosoma oryzae]
MQLRKASRQAVKLRVGFSGVSGAGKTLSALRVAYGLVNDWDKIAVIDTESGSAELYCDQTFSDGNGSEFYIGTFNYINLTNPAPEKYIEAIVACEKAGMEVIIIDSMTHAWEFILNVQAQMTGNSYTNWGIVKPRHEKLRNKILKSTAHVFTTSRRKQDYEMTKDGNGRNTVQKLGLKEINVEGWEYELTLNFEIEQNHLAKAAKDRTSLFVSRDPFMLTEETGQDMKNWATSGESDTEALLQIATIEVSNASSAGELNAIWLKFPALQQSDDFVALLKDKKNQVPAPATA